MKVFIYIISSLVAGIASIVFAVNKDFQTSATYLCACVLWMILAEIVEVAQ